MRNCQKSIQAHKAASPLGQREVHCGKPPPPAHSPIIPRKTHRRTPRKQNQANGKQAWCINIQQKPGKRCGQNQWQNNAQPMRQPLCKHQNFKRGVRQEILVKTTILQIGLKRLTPAITARPIKSATQTRPGAMSRRSFKSGPKPKGINAIAIMKKLMGKTGRILAPCQRNILAHKGDKTIHRFAPPIFKLCVVKANGS